MSAGAAERARAAGLPRLGRRPSLGSYVRALHAHRHLTIELARSRFRAANEDNRLGMAWIILRPLLNAAVYGIIFSLLLRSDTRPDNFVPFLVIGVFVFQYFASCLADGAKAMTGNLGLVRTLHFPRAALPLSVVIQQVLGLAPMMGMAAAVSVAFGEPVTWRWLLVLPALLLMTMFCTGVALVAARITLHVRDVQQLIPFVSRLLFYTSGVFFAVDRIGLPPSLEVLATVNPVATFITLVRSGLLTEVDDTPSAWVVGAVWALLALVAGAIFFWRAEEAYGRV